MNSITYTRAGVNLRERGRTLRGTAAAQRGLGLRPSTGELCSLPAPRARAGLPRQAGTGRPAPAPRIRRCRRRGKPWVRLGISHGVTGDQPKLGVLVRWGRCQRIAVASRRRRRWEDSRRTPISGQVGDGGGFKSTWKPSPSRSVPGRCSTRGLAHTLLAWGRSPSTSRSLCLLQGRPSFVLSHAEAGWRQTTGQGCAGLRRGATLTAANQGSGFAPRCPQAAPSAPRHHHGLLPSQLRHAAPGSRSSAAGGVGCRGRLRARVCPSGSALGTGSIPQSKPLTSRLSTGMLAEGQGMSAPLRLGGQTQCPYSPGLPPGLTRKEKLLYAAEKLLIHPPSLLLRPLPLHPDLTSSWRAGTSPRRLCAPVWSLKRLVRLRADTSASPERHRGFACRRGRKTTEKKYGLALSFTYLLGGQSICGQMGFRLYKRGYLEGTRHSGAVLHVRPSHPFPGTRYNVAFVRLPPTARHSKARRDAGPGPSAAHHAALRARRLNSAQSRRVPALSTHTPQPRQLPQ